MKVSDAMNAQVRTALATDTIALAMRIMLGARVSGLPVVDQDGTLVGILTEGDLIRRAEIGTARARPRWLEIVAGPQRLAREYIESHSRRVGDLMTPQVVTIEESASLADSVDLLEKHHVKRLPVTRHGALVGILSRADLMRSFLNSLPQREVGSDTSDSGIQQAIHQEMLRCPWIPRSAIQIRVSQRVVDIDGVVTSEAMRDALRVLVENVHGVTSSNVRVIVEDPARGYL